MEKALENYSESDYNISGSAEKQWGIAPNSAAVFLSLGISHSALHTPAHNDRNYQTVSKNYKTFLPSKSIIGFKKLLSKFKF